MARRRMASTRAPGRFVLWTARRPLTCALLETALLILLIFCRVFLEEAQGYHVRPGTEHRYWMEVGIATPVFFAVLATANVFLRRQRVRQGLAAAG